MKTLFITFCSLLFLLGGFPEAAKAQENEPVFYVIDYMKTKPGMNDDYLEMEQAWKKIHQARIDAGKLEAWGLQAVLSPAGTNAEYNYITYNRYVGNEQLAAHFETPMITMEQIEDILTEEELERVMRTEETRDGVKSEVWRLVDNTVADDWETGRVHVFNFFKNKAGMTADHQAMETEIWKPLHAARVADDRMKGWALLTLDLPFGSQQPYNDATIDIYADMSQYMEPFFAEYLAKVYPTMSVEQMMEKMASTDLIRGEVRMVIDRIAADRE